MNKSNNKELKMKYNDLIQFDPIETIIQLRDAGKEQSANVF